MIMNKMYKKSYFVMKQLFYSYNLALFKQRYNVKIPKVMLGSQAAINGETNPFSEKEEVVCVKKIQTKAKVIPTAKLIPIPPLRFCEERDRANMVKIIVENGFAKRKFNSF